MKLFRPASIRRAVTVRALLFVGALGLSSTASSFVWRQGKNDVFREGESILYVIKYGFIPAGHATLEVKRLEEINGRPAYYILSKARTNNAMDLIFKVRDKNESWMDAESLCSVRFYQRIREGLYRRECRTDYDHPRGRFVYWKKRKNKEQVIEGGIPAFVQDVLSSLYYIRTRDLRVGHDYMLDANSGARTWPLKVHVKKIQRIKVPAGRFECFRIEPILAGEGIFQKEGEGKLEVWLTADERRIPVLLRSRVLVGAFDAEMVEYSVGGDSFEDTVPEKDMEHEAVEPEASEKEPAPGPADGPH